MKKSLKAGLWLGILGLFANPQDGVAANQVETNKNVREVLGEKKESKINDVGIYQTTAADFKEKETTDSLDAIQGLKQMTQYTDQLVKFYGKVDVNKKINQIVKEHPNFWSLTEKEQEDILTKYFWDFLKKETDRNILVGMSFFTMLILWAIFLHASYGREVYTR